MNIAIVLGNKLNPDNSPSDELLMRLNKVLGIYKMNIDKIICSGSHSFMLLDKPLITEAEAMKDYLVYHGVNPEDIIIEDQSMDTVGNLYYSSLLLDEFDKVSLVTIISSSYHIPRARYLASKILSGYSFEFIGSEAQNGNNYNEDKVLEIYKEMFKDYSSRDDIFAILCEYLPGYSNNPKRSREYILSLVS